MFQAQASDRLFGLSGWFTALTGAAILLFGLLRAHRPGPHPAGTPAAISVSPICLINAGNQVPDGISRSFLPNLNGLALWKSLLS